MAIASTAPTCSTASGVTEAHAVPQHGHATLADDEGALRDGERLGDPDAEQTVVVLDAEVQGRGEIDVFRPALPVSAEVLTVVEAHPARGGRLVRPRVLGAAGETDPALAGEVLVRFSSSVVALMIRPYADLCPSIDPISARVTGPMRVELFLDDVPPRRRAGAVYQQLRDAITSGRLVAGDRLPTSRDLAADLGLSRTTIATVYARLSAEGYTTGRTGDGTFVAASQQRTSQPGSWPRRVDLAAPRPWRADLRTGRPDPRLFPVVAWRRSALTALQAPPPGYGDRAGLPALCAALAAWVGRSRGVIAAPEHVVVTAGAQGAFDLLADGPGARPRPSRWRTLATRRHGGRSATPAPSCARFPSTPRG